MSETLADKGSSTLQRASTIRSNQKNEPSSGSFGDRLKEIKLMIQAMLSEEKALELYSQLDDLNEIYLSDIGRERAGKSKTGEENQHLLSPNFRKSQKVLLEVREGNKIENEIKPQGEGRPVRSPEKKVEQKKFARFDPKRHSANTVTNGLLLNRKTSPEK